MSDEFIMDAKTYIETQLKIIELGKLAGTLDLDAFLKCIQNAETMAPLIDPTLFMKAQANMTAIKKLALAVRDVKSAYSEVYQVIVSSTVAGFMKNAEESNRNA